MSIKTIIAAVVVAATLALPGAAAQATTPTVSITNVNWYDANCPVAVSGPGYCLLFDVVPPTGYYPADVCTGSASGDGWGPENIEFAANEGNGVTMYVTDAPGPPNSISVSCPMSHQVRQAYKVLVKTGHLDTTGAGHPVSHRGCVQHRSGDSWIVRCGTGRGATVKWAHTFPRDALRGTRRMDKYWATHVGDTAYDGRQLVGRTVYQIVHVRQRAAVRFEQLQWEWETGVYVTRYRTVTVTTNLPGTWTP